MKLTLALLSLCCSQIALAQIFNTGANCTYILADDYNREVARFADATCSDAQYACEREKAYSVSTGSIRNGQCYQLGGGYNDGGYNGGGYNGGGYNGGGYNGGGYNGGGYNGGYNPYPGNGGLCEVSLQDSYTVTLQVFNGYDCGQALATCNQARLSRQTPYQALFCNITASNGQGGYNGGGYNGGGYNRISCTYDIKDVRTQRVVNSHMQTANTEHQACELAYNQCMTDARSRNQYSSVQNFVCAKRTVNNGGGYNGGNYGNQQYVTQSCTYKIVAMGGNVLEQVTAQGSGYGVQQAKQTACQQAAITCQNVKAQRTIPGRPSPYASAACQQAY